MKIDLVLLFYGLNIKGYLTIQNIFKIACLSLLSN